MRSQTWLALIVVFAIALGSVVGALVVGAGDHNDFERDQHEEALRAAHQAQAVAALSAGQLSSAAAFYQADRDLNRHEFEVLARTLLHHGAISGTSFVQRVTLPQRAAYERAHGFSIVDRRGGRLRRAGPRPVYFPITYTASELRGGHSLGYDLGVDPQRGAVLRRAADTGRAAATPIVPLLNHRGRGLVIYQPIYRDGAPTKTVAERREALLGFASGGFLAPDIVGAAESAIPADVSLQLRQGGHLVIGPHGTPADSASAPIRIADRVWLLIAHDPGGPSIGLPILMAVVGISLAALLGALILIWSRSERMEELQRQASQDPLTGLKNRRRFEEDLRSEMARSRRERSEGAMLMLDLDNFKAVNDSLGHPAGDRLIADVADVLRTRMRETDVLARLGGDEFAMVLPRSSTEEARVVASDLSTAIREQVPRQDGLPPVTASIGIAMFGIDPQMSPELAISEADTAMYAAKDSGRDAVRVFDPVALRTDA